MTKHEILKYLFEHKDKFYEKFKITKISLFGSYARDAATKESDIDIIIEMEKGVTDIYDKKEAFKTMIESTFGKKVNLAREKYLKPLAKKEILKDICRV